MLFRGSLICLPLRRPGTGVAVIPSLALTHRYEVRVARVVHDGKPLREPISIVWDKRRIMPRYIRAIGCAVGSVDRGCFAHFYVTLTALGHSPAPRLFGLRSWCSITMPGVRRAL